MNSAGPKRCCREIGPSKAALDISIILTTLMHDTSWVQRSIWRAVFFLLLGLGGVSALYAGDAPAWKNAVAAATHQRPDARIVIVEIESGRIVAAHRLVDAARTVSAPGSSIKPLVLYTLVRSGRWSPEQRIACNRRLIVAGHDLACTHPAAPPFDAREALAWSCNSYFAGLARTLEPGELGQLLRPTGLQAMTGLSANEAVAAFHEPQTEAEEELTVLGTADIRITPLELAAAYRWLALQFAGDPQSAAAQLVHAGLADSASFGVAGEAGAGGVLVLGKTGTAKAAPPRTAQ
jgi:cell division protein FtsI/penicillin-binding protein 2